jgi:ABC-2 type transport system permease protein
MTRLVRAELLKLRTLRVFWWSVVATLAFVPVSVAQAMLARPGAVSLDSTEGLRNVFSAASAGGVLVLVVGILVTAGEFRHNTVGSTFLITPDRRRVIGAKLATTALVGVVLGIIASLLTLAIAVPWLTARDVTLAGHATDVTVVLLGGIAATAISGLVGVGLGALVTNQTLAVTAALVWSFVVDGMLVSFLPGVGRWTPGGAASALSGVATAKGGLLPIGAAAVVFAAYGLAFAGAGSRLLMRRDIA